MMNPRCLPAVLVAILGFSIPVAGQVVPDHIDPEPEWCFLVYMCADNDLEHDAITDFREMAWVGSTHDVQVVVQLDRHPSYDARYGDWTDTRRFLITPGLTPDPGHELQILGEANMGQGPRLAPGDGSLEDFVRWAGESFPSRRRALILWDHGDGWRSPRPPVPPYKGMGEDWTDDDWLSMAEIRVALENAAAAGHDLDLIGFDACIMGMIEVAHEVRDRADVMVASERFEWSSGWPYTKILLELVADARMDAPRLGEVLVDCYGIAEPSLTLSALDLGELPALSDAVGALALTMVEQRSEIVAVRASVRQYDSFDGYNHVDLHDLAELLRQQIPAGPIHDAAGAVLAEFPDVVIDSTPEVGRDHGVAIYFPRWAAHFDEDYRAETITFARDEYWDEFLAWYFELVCLYHVGDACPGGSFELRITGPPAPCRWWAASAPAYSIRRCRRRGGTSTWRHLCSTRRS